MKQKLAYHNWTKQTEGKELKRHNKHRSTSSQIQASLKNNKVEDKYVLK